MNSDVCNWSAPPESPELCGQEVHVWLANLDLTPDRRADLNATLSPDEAEKASRFYFEKDRSHYIAGRGFLRAILSRYIELPARNLAFTYNPFGKPALADGLTKSDLSFNVSHSHGLGLYAFCQGRAIGADIEQIRPDFAIDSIAEAFFSPREVAMLRNLPDEQRPRGFFNCWTRKEAYIKARGEGLSHPLDKFAVSLAPGEHPTILWSEDPLDAPRWSMRSLDPNPDYAAAVVLDGPCSQIRCWRWDP